MEPITLIAIAAAAGFVFKKFSSQAKKNNEISRDELSYSKDIISRSNIDPTRKEIVPDIQILPEYQRIQFHYLKNRRQPSVLE